VQRLNLWPRACRHVGGSGCERYSPAGSSATVCYVDNATQLRHQNALRPVRSRRSAPRHLTRAPQNPSMLSVFRAANSDVVIHQYPNTVFISVSDQRPASRTHPSTYARLFTEASASMADTEQQP
jgi:hypothetical protein